MDKLRELLLKNRYTVLVATLALYMGVLVIEGAITGRDARVIDFDNPFFDFEVSREALERMRDEENRTDPGQ
ncbi:MAG: hypothetical protein WD396_01035 [Pseudohongiellaceae bacterium]